MRRVLTGRAVQQQAVAPATTTSRRAAGSQQAGKLRTSKRSKEYLALLRSLDTDVRTAADLEGVLAAIRAEFGASSSPFPTALLAKCYLGHPFEVHVLDLYHQIVEHYEFNRCLPDPYEEARRLAIHPSYALVEVYDSHLLCIKPDGSTVQVPR